ncbi:MAG: hypothetical protein ACYS9T_07985, partial [Planctomycetota bacterium]
MARTYKFWFTKKNAMDTEDSARGLVLSTAVSFAMVLTTVVILVGGCTGASGNTVVRDITAANCDNSITINRARKTVEENLTHSWS